MSDEAVPPQMSDEAAPQTFSSALPEAIRRISDQLLLYLLAGAMIIAGAAVWGPESLGTLVVPLLVLLLAGLVGWIAFQALRIRAGKSAILQSTRVGRFTRVRHIKYGKTHGEKGTTVDQRVRVGTGSRVDEGITFGDTDARRR